MPVRARVFQDSEIKLSVEIGMVLEHYLHLLRDVDLAVEETDSCELWVDHFLFLLLFKITHRRGEAGQAISPGPVCLAEIQTLLH